MEAICKRREAMLEMYRQLYEQEHQHQPQQPRETGGEDEIDCG